MRPLPPLPEWVALEHTVAKILSEQERHGWYFDERAAWQLTSALQQELQDLEKVLRERHPYVAGAEFTPKRNNKTSGYIEGATFTRLKELSPSSRDHIAWILTTFYGWKPKQETVTGKPVVDEVILTEIGSEISMMFARCLTVTKMLGMLSNGVNAWLKLSTTSNRIHHHCSVATVTHRCAHRKPNLSQVPSDHDCRQLFKASPGKVMVGADLSGIELRMLAHYLSKWSTEFADTLLNGDIHQVNADRVGVSRSEIKRITYCFTYGGGNLKLGKTFDYQLSDEQAKAKGAELRQAFVSSIDGLAELLESIKLASNRGYVKSIDGRPIKVDSQHKALNYLLQSGAGVIAKRWMVLNDTSTKQLGIPCNQLAFIHDELQFETHPNYADALSTSLKCSAWEAGQYYNLRIPIAAEAKQGYSWADVH